MNAYKYVILNNVKFGNYTPQDLVSFTLEELHEVKLLSLEDESFISGSCTTLDEILAVKFITALITDKRNELAIENARYFKKISITTEV